MNKIIFTAPDGVTVEGVVLNEVCYKESSSLTEVCVQTVYAQNRIAEFRTEQDLDGNLTTIVKPLVEYATIPELD